MLTHLILTAGDIPIPELPIRESVASPGLRSLIIGGALIVTVIYLGYNFVYRGMKRIDQGKPVWKTTTILIALSFALTFAAMLSTNADKDADSAASDAYWQQLEEVSMKVYDQIEEKYDTILEFRNVIPIVPKSTYTASDYIEFTVTRPDVAGQPCYLAAPGGYYTIRCGGDSFDTSTDLPLP